MSVRPWYPVSREFWAHPDWCKRSAHERLAWLYLLSVTRWRDGDGIRRGQARTSAADIGREVDKPRARAHDWLKRWASIGAISYEVEVDEANRPTGIVVTVLGYERWAANAKAYANHADDSGVSGEAPDAKADADAQPDAGAYATPDARPDAGAYARPDAGNIDGSSVSDEGADAKAYAGADATPDARPDASYTGHDLGHGRGGKRAQARDATPSLPGLESPEGVDGRRTDPSPTPPATAPAPASVGAVPGAVERRWGAVMPGSTEFSKLVGEVLSAAYAEKYPGSKPFERNGIVAKRKLMAEVLHPMALETTPDAALDVLRAQVRRYFAMGGSKASAKHPLWFLYSDWQEILDAGDPKPVDPADPHDWKNQRYTESDFHQWRLAGVDEETIERERERARGMGC